MYLPTETEASPRVRSAFSEVRQRQLPEIARTRYAAAKAAFDRKEYPGRRAAVPRSAEAHRRSRHGRPAGRPAHARDRIRRSERRPRRRRRPRRSRQGPSRAARSRAAPAQPCHRSAEACSRSTTKGRGRRRAIRQEVPRVPVQIASQTRDRGILEVTIDEQGRVIQAKLRALAAPDLRLADARRDARLALSAGDAQRPAGQVPQDHSDHGDEVGSGGSAGSGGSVVQSAEFRTCAEPEHPRNPRNLRDAEHCVHSPPMRSRLVTAARCGRAAGAACARHEPAPPPRVARRYRAAGRNAGHRSHRAAAGDARVAPRSITNCRAHLVQAAIESARVGLRSAPAARRAAVPPRALRRRPAAGVRVPDRRRSLPAHRQPRSLDAREARRRSAALREGRSRSSAIRGRIDREHPSLIAAMTRAGERDSARDRAGRDLQRPDRLRERSAARRLVRGAVRDRRRTRDSSPATARSSARGSSTTARSTRPIAG